jgi:hypothetical protein
MKKMKNVSKKPMMILMAIVQNPITGRTKKKFGNAVFSKQFGKNTLRTKPIEVKNPRTPGQVNQRSKFKLMVFQSRLLIGMIRISFQNMAIGKSAFNAFMQANIKTAITGIPGNYTINYPALIVAKGPLFQVQNLVAGNDLAGKVKRTWDIPTDPLDPSNSDKLYNVAYNVTKNEWSYGQPGTLRSAGTDEQGVPANWSGNTVHVYTFFISSDGKKCSDSIYSGTVVIS